MSIPIRSAMDFAQNELQSPRIHNLASAPSGVEGQIYHNTTDHILYVYNGTTFVQLNALTAEQILSLLLTVDGPTSGLNADLLDNNDSAFFLARANHTGTQLASTISNFDTQVRTSRLDQMAAPTASVSMNSQKITNLLTPTAANDAANKTYVDAIAQGFRYKPTARVATTAALPACTYNNGTSGVGATLTGNSNGALTVDSYAVVAAEYVVVKDQASGLQNGLYVVTQPGSAGTPFILTRDGSMDTTAEFQGAFIPVEDAGTTNANSLWLCTNSADPTVGTTAITFIQLNKGTDLSGSASITITGNVVTVNSTWAGQSAITTLGTITTGTWTASVIGQVYGGTGIDSSSAAGKLTAAKNLNVLSQYSATIGDNSATSFTITQATHKLAANGTNSVHVYDATSGAEIGCDRTVAPGSGNVTVAFSVAPTTNQYRVLITGVPNA